MINLIDFDYWRLSLLMQFVTCVVVISLAWRSGPGGRGE